MVYINDQCVKCYLIYTHWVISIVVLEAGVGVGNQN